MKEEYILLIIIIILFSLMYVGIEYIQIDIETNENKLSFCDSKDMGFREHRCGFRCFQDQCYNEQGAFELEIYRDGFLLIGYEEDLIDNKEVKKNV